MNTAIPVHETAFLTSTLRALDEKLSRDKYAQLWSNPRTDKWVEKYLKETTNAEITAHGFRNLFFLEHIQNLFEKKEIEVLINFGCGFSMYPYLLPEELINIEIDKPEVIEHKSKMTHKWQQEGILPKRNIQYIEIDFSTKFQEELDQLLMEIKGNKKCFILIEGVLFFLKQQEADNLFDFFEKIQQSGDFIGSVSFLHSMTEKEGYHRLLTYLNKGISKGENQTYLTLDNDFYLNRKYSLIDHKDYFSMSRKMNMPVEFNEDLILNENYYLLKKN